MLNPLRLGIRSPLPMFILRGKHIPLRHPSPSTKGLGGTLGGLWAATTLTPCATSHEGLQPHCSKATCQTPGSSQGHPKTSCLLWGGPAAMADIFFFIEVARGEALFPGAKAGVSLPKANFFLRASSPQHPSKSCPPPAHVPSQGWLCSDTQSWCGCGLSGGISQVKEEGTAHNSGLCRTAVAPNFCQPFQTHVSPNSHGVGAPFSYPSSKPLQAMCLLCPKALSRAPRLPAFLTRGCSPSWGQGTVWAPNSLVLGRCGGCSVNTPNS